MKLYLYTCSAQEDVRKECFLGSLPALQEKYICDIVQNLSSIPSIIKEEDILLFVVNSVHDFLYLKEAAVPFNNLMIAANYLFDEEFRRINFDFLKPLEDKGIHVIYPNEIQDSLHFPNTRKIIDTIVHNTTRSKYISIQEDTDIQKHLPFAFQLLYDRILELSRIIEHRGLNPDSFAGAIALRAGNGVFITSTHTDKTRITPERVCYILEYDHEENAITWAGTTKPSSEAPIANMVFREMANMNILIHFHYKPLTYSSLLDYYRTDHYEPYGTYEEARAVVDKLEQTGYFAIAQGHGEIVVADSLDRLNDELGEIMAKIK